MYVQGCDKGSFVFVSTNLLLSVERVVIAAQFFVYVHNGVPRPRHIRIVAFHTYGHHRKNIVYPFCVVALIKNKLVMLMIHTWHIETVPATACTPTHTHTRKKNCFFRIFFHFWQRNLVMYYLLKIGTEENSGRTSNVSS